MAHGGEVGHFCSEAREHDSGCEYYFSGGRVNGEYVDSSEVSDELPAEMLDKSGAYVDPSEVSEHPPENIKDKYVDPSEVSDHPPSQTSGIRDTAASFIEGTLEGAIGSSAKGVLNAGSKINVGGYGPQSSFEDQARWEQEHPTAHEWGKVVGSAAANAAIGAELKMVQGGMFIANAITAFSHRFGDAVGNSLMGVPGGDPEPAVANAIAGGITDTLYSSGMDLAFGAGSKLLPKTLGLGKKVVEEWAEKPIENSAILALGEHFGGHHGMAEAGMAKVAFDKVFGKTVDKIASSTVGKARAADRRIGEGILNVLQKGKWFGLNAAIDFAEKVSKGESAIAHGIKSIMKGTGESDVVKPTKEEFKDAIGEWVGRGGVDAYIDPSEVSDKPPEGFAKGGEVSDGDTAAFSKIYPEHNVLLNDVRGKTSNYLKSIKPNQHMLRLPFDRESSQKEQHREYRKALGYAANPISILNDINKGTLSPKDMKHFTSMNPGFYSHLSKEITNEITKIQLKKGTLPYKKRQSLSLFLGAALDSTFTPQAIQATQSVYAMKSQMQQPQSTPKKSTASLSKLAPSSLTNEQARIQRQQNQKA